MIFIMMNLMIAASYRFYYHLAYDHDFAVTNRIPPCVGLFLVTALSAKNFQLKWGHASLRSAILHLVLPGLPVAHGLDQ